MVRSRCGADAGTYALSLDNGYSARTKTHTERTLIPARKHCACAVGGASEVAINNQEWQGSRRVVLVLETVDRLFFMKVGRKFILLDRNQYLVQDL